MVWESLSHLFATILPQTVRNGPRGSQSQLYFCPPFGSESFSSDLEKSCDPLRNWTRNVLPVENGFHQTQWSVHLSGWPNWWSIGSGEGNFYGYNLELLESWKPLKMVEIYYGVNCKYAIRSYPCLCWQIRSICRLLWWNWPWKSEKCWTVEFDHSATTMA